MNTRVMKAAGLTPKDFLEQMALMQEYFWHVLNTDRVWFVGVWCVCIHGGSAANYSVARLDLNPYARSTFNVCPRRPDPESPRLGNSRSINLPSCAQITTIFDAKGMSLGTLTSGDNLAIIRGASEVNE